MYKRIAIVFASAAALTGLAAVATSAPAFADGVVSQSYTIGTGAVTNVTAAVQPDTASSTANYTVGLVTPAALAAGSDTITLSDPAGSAKFPSAAGAYAIVDETHGSSTQTASAVSSASGSHKVTIALGTSIAAADSLVVEVFGATTPASPGTYVIAVTTSKDDTTVFSNVYQVVAASAAPTYAPTISPSLAGAASTYTIGSFKATAALAAGSTIQVGSRHAAGLTDNVGFPSDPGSYTVTDSTTSSGTGTAQSPVTVAAVPSADGSGQIVTLKVPNAINAKDELTVTVKGVLNPSTAQTDTLSAAAPASGAATTGTVVVGTSVSDLTVGVSPATAGFASAAYTIGVKVTSAMAAGDKFYVVAPSGTSFASSYVILIDVTTPAGSGAVDSASLGATAVNGSSAANSIGFPVPAAIKAGDYLSIQLLDVGNPPAGAYGASSAALSVSTQDDMVVAQAPSYTIGTGPSAVQPAVAVDPATPGASAIYTITDLKAAAALPAGSGTVQLEAPTGTAFPSNSAEYMVSDLSSSAGTGEPAVTSGGNSNTVTLQVGKPIALGDVFQIVVTGAINPSPGQYSITFVGPVIGGTLPTPPPTTTTVPRTTTTAPPVKPPVLATLPSARTTYPNDALVKVANGTIYLFAGGKALPITSSKQWALVRHFDSSVVLRGTVSRSQVVARMRAGTAIQVAGKGTYWIAGTDGKLRARSHAQYLAAGYDPSQLIEVGGLTDLSFAKGAPSSAVALRADGALFVTPSRVDYVMAGNKAFAFTTHAELLATMALDHARMLSRSITASWRMAVPVNGTLFRVHNRGVFVSYGGVLYGPVSAARLSADGYLSARAVPVPSTAGLRTRATA